jgi:preprotein translocase subunit SecG
MPRSAQDAARGRTAFLARTSFSAGVVFLFLTILTLVGVQTLEPC